MLAIHAHAQDDFSDDAPPLDRCEVVRRSVMNLLVPLDDEVNLAPEKREELRNLVDRACKRFGTMCELSFCHDKPTPTPEPSQTPLTDDSDTIDESAEQNPFDRFHEYAEFKLKTKKERIHDEEELEKKEGRSWRLFTVPE